MNQQRRKTFRSEHAQVIAHGTDEEIRDHLDKWRIEYPQDTVAFQAMVNCSRLTAPSISTAQKSKIKYWLSLYLYHSN